MQPETLEKWFPVFRDFSIVAVCLFLLIFEAIFTTPNPIIIGLVGTALIGPAALRMDAGRRKKQQDDEDDT